MQDSPSLETAAEASTTNVKSACLVRRWQECILQKQEENIIIPSTAADLNVLYVQLKNRKSQGEEDVPGVQNKRTITVFGNRQMDFMPRIIWHIFDCTVCYGLKKAQAEAFIPDVRVSVSSSCRSVD